MPIDRKTAQNIFQDASDRASLSLATTTRPRGAIKVEIFGAGAYIHDIKE